YLPSGLPARPLGAPAERQRRGQRVAARRAGGRRGVAGRPAGGGRGDTRAAGHAAAADAPLVQGAHQHPRQPLQRDRLSGPAAEAAGGGKRPGAAAAAGGPLPARRGAAHRPFARLAQSRAAREEGGEAAPVGPRAVHGRRGQGVEGARRGAARAAPGLSWSGDLDMKKLLLVVAALVTQPAFSQGVTSDKILLGQSVALTGPAAELGIQMRNGAKIYFDHVYALFGYVGTPTSSAAMPLFTEAKVPFFGAFTGAEVFRQPFNRYIFNVRASYYDETDKIVEQVVSTGGKTIAVFYQNDGYGQAGLKGVEIAMTKRNMKISATGAFERNTVDVGGAVKGINAATPDAVVMIGAYKACAEFIK